MRCANPSISPGYDAAADAGDSSGERNALRMSDLIGAWRDRVRAAAAGNEPLRIVGGGSKDFYGHQLVGSVFGTNAVFRDPGL